MINAVVKEPQIVVRVAQPGLPGPPGPPGADGAATLTLTAGPEGVSGHRVVVLTPSGVRHADITDPAHADAALGLTLGAAVAGTQVTIQVSGEVIESSWDWTPGLPLFVAVDGLLSHAAPASGWTQMIAVALSPTKILLTPRQAVHLA